MPDQPLLLIVLAGPNGAGKTSFYEQFLKRLALPFVNADIMARDKFGASAHALAAARFADAERRRLIEQRRSFVMETVLSDSAGHKLTFFREAREAGYRVEAIFIGIASAALSAARVIGRVADGGHDVPLDRIEARYPRTLANLAVLCALADRLTIFDNSLRTVPFRVVAVLEQGRAISVSDPVPAWANGIGLEERITETTTRHPL